MLPSSGKICEFSHVTNSHIFPDEGSIAENWTFIHNYQRLTYHLPSFNTHKRYAGTPLFVKGVSPRGEGDRDQNIKPSTQLSLALEKHLRLPPPPPPPPPPANMDSQKEGFFYLLSR